MATAGDLRCDLGGRRAELRARIEAGDDITGIDYLEVDPADQRRLSVHFLGDVPAIPDPRDRIAIHGGRRVEVQVLAAETEMVGDRTYLAVEVDRPGDFSDYVLEIARRAHDPLLPPVDELFRRCTFNFKVSCPTRFDCRPPDLPPQATEPGIDIDYLAKDYASFRRALLDLLPHLAPQWSERLAADLGITIVELLAYAGDQLSYYQDAVANEAFLETARQRISVRRHARLVDYHMHDGASARTFVHLRLHTGTSLTIDADEGSPDAPLVCLTRITEPIGASPPGAVIDPDDAHLAVALADTVFHTSTGGRLDARLNEIGLYDWGNHDCVLPVGARTADLEGDLEALLRPDDLLLLEEVRDPLSGDPGLADRSHRQIVRLGSVERIGDNLRGGDVTRVTWAEADALRFPLWITRTLQDAGTRRGHAVARGNLLVADQGRQFTESGLVADRIASGTRADRFRLHHGPLGFRHPLPDPARPVAELFDTDPGRAVPQVDSVTVAGSDLPETWSARQPNLIGADRFERVFAVETDNAGEAVLRFGDGVFGAAAPPGAAFEVTYRVGVGAGGHIGADAIAHVITGEHGARIAGVTNPLPAWGGSEPESAARVKRIAPAAFRSTQFRAVTEEDYAQVATRHPAVRNAIARFRWTGSWHTAFIAIDPPGGRATPELLAEVADHVAGFALAGYDIRVVPPRDAPLDIELEVCVDRGHFREDVGEAVADVLTSGRRRDGAPGFFHPDRFTFGQPLHISRLYAAVAAVEGVESVVATRFAPLTSDDAKAQRRTEENLADGAIRVAAMRILRLDNDPDFPENGLLRIELGGGK